MSETTQPAAFLRYTKADGTAASVPITDAPVYLGRHVENQLVVEDATVSRHHAEIVPTPAGHVFRDRQSKRGSFVNRQPVAERVLRHGDVIMLGRPDGAGITYEVPAAEAARVLDDDAMSSVSRVVRPDESRYINLRDMDAGALQSGPAAARLKALYEITTVTLAAKSKEDLCRDLLDRVAAAVPGERGWILLRDDATGDLNVVAQVARKGLPDSEGRPSRTVVTRVIDEQVAILSMNAMADARFAAQESVAGQAIRSVMCAPLASAHQAWGVCYVDRRTAGASFDAEQLEFLTAACHQAGVVMENLHLLEEQRRALESFISTLTEAIDARDVLTAGHSARVAQNGSAFAAYLGKDAAEVRLTKMAGQLHDIGKIGTRDDVLQKPGRLTADEFDHMKEHTRNTQRILTKIRFTDDLQDLPMIAAAHHEALDGSGYLDGLRGEQIRDLTRYLSICDVFDALTSKRHYREPMSRAEAFGILDGMTPNKLDVELVTAFKRFVEDGRWQSEVDEG